MITKSLMALLLLVLATDAAAHGFRHGDLEATHPWARATAASAANGAVYMAISNGSAQDERLLGAETPMASEVQLHMHEMVDGMMQMRRIDSIDIAPGDTVLIEPGGLHLMLLGLKTPLEQGTLFPMTLVFERAGRVEIQVFVEGPGATEPAEGMDHGEHVE